jgi:hypothetical protein
MKRFLLLAAPLFAVMACATTEPDDDDTPDFDDDGAAALSDGKYTARSGTLRRSDLAARTTDPALPRIDFLRPVLQGVLYRGGFKGGDRTRAGLAATTKNFCGQGFSAGRYVDFATAATRFGTTECEGNDDGFAYAKASSSSPEEIMETLHTIIKEKKGPMFVHCMWGVHASGAVSAMALMQFCGWSQSEATSYWHSARNGADCSGGCDRWIGSKLGSFRVNPALAITEEEASAICPH